MCDAWHEVPPSGTELYTARPADEQIIPGDIIELPFGDHNYKVRVVRTKLSIIPGKQHVVMEIL